MTTDQLMMFVAAAVLFFLVVNIIIKFHLRKKPQRKLITEKLVKILHNPIDEKWMWTKFNPRSRTWEWTREATPTEIVAYKDLIFSEEMGDKILSLGENHND